MIDDILAKFDGAFVENTIRVYRSDFLQYQTWCSLNNIKSLPAIADDMAQWFTTLPQKKSATIRRRINSLGTVLNLSKHYNPTNQPQVILAIKRMPANLDGHSSRLLHSPCHYSISYLVTVITVSGV